MKKGTSSYLCIGFSMMALAMQPSTAAAAQAPGGGQRKMALATASLGGTYYIVGAGIADLLTKNVPGLKVDAIIAQGSVGNPRLVPLDECV